MRHCFDAVDPLGLVSDSYVGCLPSTSALIIANHPILVDLLLVIARVPDVCCVMKSELNRIKVLQILMKQLDYVSNEDLEQLLQEGCERLKKGETLLIFPEGTRTTPGQPVDFRLAAAELALRAGVPVLPIIFRYRSHYLSGRCHWYEFPDAKIRFHAEFMDAIRTPAHSPDRRTARRKLNADLQEFFRERLVT